MYYKIELVNIYVIEVNINRKVETFLSKVIYTLENGNRICIVVLVLNENDDILAIRAIFNSTNEGNQNC